MSTHKPLSHEALTARLLYDPETGVFRRRPSGAKAGSLDKSGGYIRIRVCGMRFYAHRLAWFYCFGEWPREEIDHKNRTKTDNSFGNLRDVPSSVNAVNRVAPQSNNALGVRGVSPDRNSFSACISIRGKQVKLGTFKTLEQAQAVRSAAVDAYHGVSAS